MSCAGLYVQLKICSWISSIKQFHIIGLNIIMLKEKKLIEM